MSVLLVFAGGMAGAPARYLLDRSVQRLVQRRFDGSFPWGTLVVNLMGSFILGLLTGAQPPAALGLLLGTGFCGALTTFSTFGYETLRLLEEGSWLRAALNAGVSLVAGVALAAAGFWTGGML
ncbi:fluoride efflux transporter CrcB [Nonomuraea sp. NBC_01738]|uniref:fluoride efflux transporter CrcB n=1 Tax=Nonomuraea sp. NBC_01738 TaxID=2976003 RepID=UPI002E1260B8|nr:fluoride efflux transporter CrcB [Nonomuraea sp. NBC_01738]